ncbi:hypothetical protein [Cupriavidus pinatubonensis]|uniref:Uncharacterized protein n=1 Tax=Cupriavidus pinatubonensis TaxID=248026 RepID=A0ABN7Y9B3_9BURK|nr:hypothetical protein [Cupriavidus pinatubonensis]CAG9169937.1 hypothetical protein LMG23994_01738 [Cupriavidus pinatubonensis]
MGILVIQSDDPHVTPNVSTNATGSFPWCGAHESSLDAADVVSILNFCRSEGYARGWNDAVYSRVIPISKMLGDSATGNFFHRDLLGGYPHEEFARSYERGAMAFAESDLLSKM